MITNLRFNDHEYEADLQQPLDVSIPLKMGETQVNCFYAPLFEAIPVKAGDFIGSTAAGGAVNFYNLQINPHGNGTHTECVGHIARKEHFNTSKDIVFNIQESLTKFHFFAKLCTLYPTRLSNGDRVILPTQIKEILQPGETEALLIRTMPNGAQKKERNYSGSNPPYFDPAAIEYLVECGVQHLLIDLPSVDREEDGGKLSAHKAYWQYPADGQNLVKNGKRDEQFKVSRVEDFKRKKCTITELIYVKNEIQDGLYLLNLQILSLEMDASPSKPVLYQLRTV